MAVRVGAHEARLPAPRIEVVALTSTLSGWGRAPCVPAREVRSEDLPAVTRDVPLTRGLGRAYGDAALPAPGDDRGLARLVDHLRRHRALLAHLAGAARPSVAWRTWADALAELRLDHLRPRPSPVHL